jgi:glutaredoxin-like protein NrdH
MIGQRPKRDGEWWNPHDHNPANPEYARGGNEQLDEGEEVPLHEVHYHTGLDGDDWVKVKMPPGTTVRAGLPTPPHTASRLAMPTWYHLTDNPDFQLDPSKVPTNLNYYDLGAGVFLTQRPEEWASSSASSAWPSDWEDDDEWNGDRPYVAEIDAPDDLHKLPGTKYAPDAMRPHDMPGSEEIFVPADQYHHLTVKNVRSRNTQPKTWKANLMTAAITVYTQPSCIQCTMTKKQLDKLGIDHETVDVTQDPDAHAYVTGLGYTAAPVVVVNDGEDHWAGFKPDRLRGLVE